MRHGPINWTTEVWCKHCGEKRFKTECDFLNHFGYQCPECGRRTRSKAHRKSVYVPVVRSKYNIDRDIRELIGKHLDKKDYNKLWVLKNKDRIKEYNRQYHLKHKEIRLLAKEKARME